MCYQPTTQQLEDTFIKFVNKEFKNHKSIKEVFPILEDKAKKLIGNFNN